VLTLDDVIYRCLSIGRMDWCIQVCGRDVFYVKEVFRISIVFPAIVIAG
jgi:hypothetical protein